MSASGQAAGRRSSRWVEVSLAVAPDRVDEAVAIMAKYGYGGAVVDEEREGTPERSVFTVKVYFPRIRDWQAKRDALQRDLAAAGLSRAAVPGQRVLEPDEWLSSWKKHFDLIEVGKRLLIRPSWLRDRPVPPGRLVIELDPDMAFGTGQHATTRLCLVRLEKHLEPGMNVLDLGTGSGILAIAAARLGAASVLALDNDPVAVEIAKQNIRLNDAGGVVAVARGTVTASRRFAGRFDLLVANITSRVIASLAEALAAALRPGGTLITSGINEAGLDMVLVSLAAAGISLKSIDREGEWHAVAGVAPS